MSGVSVNGCVHVHMHNEAYHVKLNCILVAVVAKEIASSSSSTVIDSQRKCEPMP